jgi:hypothetical protein
MYLNVASSVPPNTVKALQLGNTGSAQSALVLQG